MFEYMGDRISKAIKNIRGMGTITEENISEAMREIRLALLEADVNYQVVKEFVSHVKENSRRPSIFSESPTNLIGICVRCLTDKATPPLVLPSSFVRIVPVSLS